MKLLVGYKTALRYWREANDLKVASLKTYRTKSVANSTTDARAIKSRHLGDYGIAMSEDDPLEILTDSRTRRCNAKGIVARVWSGPIPQDAFRTVADGVYVSTPEFVFAQLAAWLDVIELARLGNELCGTYYLNRSGGYGDRTRPLTSKARLADFVNRAGQFRGRQTALQALRVIADNSASPRETITLLALCLPRRLGGYALPLPTLNATIDVSERFKGYVGGTTYRPDFMWVRTKGKERVIVTAEYDSHLYHDSERDAEHTRIRRNEFKAMHILTNSINKSQLESGSAFLLLARQIARDLGIYRKPSTLEAIYRCDELLRQLTNEAVF